MTGGKHRLPPIQNRGSNMSLNKKLNILLILTSLTFGLLFAITILGYFFPGEPLPNQAPWFVWALVGEVIAFAIATVVTCFFVHKKDKELKEQFE